MNHEIHFYWKRTSDSILKFSLTSKTFLEGTVIRHGPRPKVDVRAHYLKHRRISSLHAGTWSSVSASLIAPCSNTESVRLISNAKPGTSLTSLYVSFITWLFFEDILSYSTGFKILWHDVGVWKSLVQESARLVHSFCGRIPYPDIFSTSDQHAIQDCASNRLQRSL